MINTSRKCALCNNKNYVSIIYGRYTVCDVCIRILISVAIEQKVNKRAEELKKIKESEEE